MLWFCTALTFIILTSLHDSISTLSEIASVHRFHIHKTTWLYPATFDDIDDVANKEQHTCLLDYNLDQATHAGFYITQVSYLHKPLRCMIKGVYMA